MQPVHLQQFLSYRVNRVSDAVGTIVSQVYEREVKLTLRELRVLRTVNSVPGVAHSEIVELVLFEKSLVSRLISGLVNKGYLKREIDKADARRTSLTLTRRGTAILGKADQLGVAMNDVWLASLTREEQKTFDTCLDKLTSGLEQLAERFEVAVR